MSNIFFVSDMHFGHRNIIEYCKRPFKSVEDMNEGLIKNWNEVVKHEDKVYHLGDWAFNDYYNIARLNGRIYSVPGNHDTERMKKIAPFVTEWLPELSYLNLGSQERTFVLCHYPMEAWHRKFKYHLHGHLHGKGKNTDTRMDVGVDATRLYRPISIDEVFENLK
jgi:calcineurin-like phosphoesterase family protein